MQIINDYTITENTIAIEPHIHPQYQTKISDLEGTFYTSERPIEILARSCIHFGASYDGRREAAIKFTHFIQKTPVLISEVLGIIALPTHSPDHPDCTWIMYHQIKEVIHTSTSHQCHLLFHNYKKLQIPISSQTMRQQTQKAAVIYSIFCTGQRIKFSFVVVDGGKRR
ncbi:competence protein ComK [Sutcliffiella rhizosphaerae]|uniref:Competence transcription factor n=1 Tax=Sutcliffiella rhizosphaerae TaxID=2880967 RepID=A0ABM8YN96_9BACI|nr:competence protein ComK [Sutcliffiella rhizosphaerae]CAG9621235.1 Competence transcription factor [Sutcliffiella rhizosphaerae]